MDERCSRCKLGEDSPVPQDEYVLSANEGEASLERALESAVEVQPDSLSCGQMLLAAARAFATRKIVELAGDLEQITQELG